MLRGFSDTFLLGCATAAHQVEGHLDNDWTRMEREHPQRIRDGSTSEVACDHHRRYREDLQQLAALHQNAHRFSIEWSRVEPRPGCFDAVELDHYADVIRTCRALGLEPIVTLHHFTLPTWVADGGGVCGEETPWLFARFAAACAERFGTDVRWWVTLNEPNVLAVFGYLYGEWPPLQRGRDAMLDALAGMARMHAAAYRALHAVASDRQQEIMVTFAHHERPLRPARRTSPLDRAAAVIPDLTFNRWFLAACRTGRLLPPVGHGQRVAGLRGALDYLALNYYCEELVRFSWPAWRSFFAEQSADPSLPHSAFGWSIDAGGLRRALLRLWRRHRLPILITENGVADDHDELRPAFVRDHLGAVAEAIAGGADIRGYLHWSSMDNFEWAEGYSKRFGLLAVDRQTMERTPKPSAAVFAEICRTRALPAGLVVAG